MPDSALTSHPIDRVVCFGELLLRLSPPAQELPLQSAWLRAHFGGAEGNVAASLALLGHASAMVSTIADNFLGRACVGELRRLGVDTRGVGYGEGRMGLYFYSPGAMARPGNVVYDRLGSAFAQAPEAAYDWPHLLAGADWLHVSGINLALGEVPARICLAAVKAAHAAGVRVSFDCNYRSKLWRERVTQAPVLLREVASQADLVFGNERDMALILDWDLAAVPEAECFAQAGRIAFAAWPRLARLATTTRKSGIGGEKELQGWLALRDDKVLSTPARSLAGTVDRIGSGDAFAAGLLHGLLVGMDDAAALGFALTAAWLKHSVPGDMNVLREADVAACLGGAGGVVLR